MDVSLYTESDNSTTVYHSYYSRIEIIYVWSHMYCNGDNKLGCNIGSIVCCHMLQAKWLFLANREEWKVAVHH